MGKNLQGKELGKGINQMKDGRYRGRYTDEHGKRIALYDKNLQKLKRELKLKQKKAFIKKETGDFDNPIKSNLTLNEIYEMWRDNELIPSNRKESTKNSYISVYSKHVYKTFGKIKITEFDYDLLLRYLNKVEQKDKITIVLKQIFEYAVKSKIITDNCAKQISTKNNTKSKIIYLTNDEQKTLIKYSRKKNEYFSKIIIIALNTGMRIGEISGLSLDELDFDNNLIYIKHQVIKYYYNHEYNMDKVIMIYKKTVFNLDTPKSKSSMRIVPMNKDCKEALMWLLDHKNYVTREGYIKHRKVIYQNDELMKKLIMTYNGIPITTDSLNAHLNFVIDAILKDNPDFRIKHISMHGLRHSFATRCLDKNINTRVIQKLLGHNTDRITELYAHVTDTKIIEDFKKYF